MKKKTSNSYLRLLLPFILAMSATTVIAQEWPAVTLEAKPGTRWWWLGSAVDKDNIQWSIANYVHTGIGAVEITPIYGVQGNQANELSYLSPQWMKALGTVMSEGVRDTIEIDMNTGTGWPFGGPEVPISEAACKVLFNHWDVNNTEKTVISLDIIPSDAKEKEYAVLGKLMAYPENGNPLDITHFVQGTSLRWDAPKGNWRLYALFISRTRQMVKRAAPGGEGYVIDHFDRNAVSHYLQKFDNAFEKSGNYFPHTLFNDSYEVHGANWTPTLLDEFYKRRGYKLEDHIPELLGEKDDSNKTLCDYRETMSDLLISNFTEQWTDWAHRNNSITRNQAHGSPANLIDTYAVVDIPEIEGFGLSDFGIKGLRKDSGFTRKNFSDLSMLKYASSAAHITGKKYTSSETFTWLTEHFRTSLSQCKPDLDLMFVSGVNHVFFHGTCYSPKDDPWPGWKFYASIDMSPTNSIWHDAPYFMQYITRCQSFLQWGQPDNDFLVYLPVRSMWHERLEKGENGLSMNFDIHTMDKKAPHFIQTILDIDSLGFDCDYISDKYLLSTVYHNGSLETDSVDKGSYIAKYKAILVPDSAYMPEKVKAHLAELQKQGAVICYGWQPEEMLQSAKPEVMKSVYHLKAIRRKNDKGYHYFIANLTPNDIHTVTPLAIPFKSAMIFNPLTGEKHVAVTSGNKVNIDLRSGESMILQTFDKEEFTEAPKPTPVLTNPRTIAGPWKLEFSDCAPAVSGVFLLPKLKSWENINDETRITMGTGTYTTTFKVSPSEIKSAGDFVLDLGDVRESARVWLNGRYLGCAWSVPFVIACKHSIKAGINTLRIDVTNLPANRIADLDRRGVKWRKFNEINIVDINYKKSTYADWKPVPSGLNSSVKLYQVK